MPPSSGSNEELSDSASGKGEFRRIGSSSSFGRSSPPLLSNSGQRGSSGKIRSVSQGPAAKRIQTPEDDEPSDAETTPLVKQEGEPAAPVVLRRLDSKTSVKSLEASATGTHESLPLIDFLSDQNALEDNAFNHDVEVEEDIDRVKQFSARDKAYFLFDGVPPQYRHVTELRALYPWSPIIVNLTMLLVFVSCMSFSVETLPQYTGEGKTPQSLKIIEMICVIWFTIDLAVRFTTTRTKKAFVLGFLNWIDLLSVLPFYLELFTGDGSGATSILIMVRILRLVRAVRVFKLSKHSKGLKTVVEALRRSKAALSLLAFLLAIMLLLYASAMYFAEQTESDWDESRRLWIRPDGTVSPFQSIIHSMWFVIVTITTVGYGDDFPYSVLGKLVAATLMSGAAFVVAFPTVVLSANFADAHANDDDNMDDFQRQFHRRHSAGGDSDASYDSNPEPDHYLVRNFKPEDLKRHQVTISLRRRQQEAKTASREVLTYRLATGAPQRRIYIIDNTARYDPVLMMMCKNPAGEEAYGVNAACRVQVGVRKNFPAGFIATFNLILHNRRVHDIVQREVKARFPDEKIAVQPRKIRSLKVAIHSSHALLHSARVLTAKYKYPVGTLPLEVHIPKLDALPVLLRYSVSVGFNFLVEYDDGSSYHVETANVEQTAGISVMRHHSDLNARCSHRLLSFRAPKLPTRQGSSDDMAGSGLGSSQRTESVGVGAPPIQVGTT